MSETPSSTAPAVQELAQEHFPAKYVDDIAKISAEQNYFSPVWQDVVARLGGFERMLDVGCGTGVFSAEAKKRTGCKLYGVDGSDYALRQAAEIGFETLACIADFNADRLPFADAQFDFCLCKDLLEHLVRPDFVLGEAHRVLKPGGHLLVHVPNHFPLQGRIRFLFTNDIDTFHYFPGAQRWDFPHIRFFTYASLLELVQLSGFRVIANLSGHFPAIPLGRFLLPVPAVRRRVATRYSSQFAEGLTLLVQKP